MNPLRRIWPRVPPSPLGNYSAADYRRWSIDSRVAHAVRARTLAIASAALAIVAMLLVAASALGHTAAATATCERATFRLAAFPRALSLIAVDVEVDGRPGPRIMGTWEGPAGDLVLPLGLAGDHVVDLYAMWSAPDQSRPRHLVGSASLSCRVPTTPPPPPPAPAPTPQPETTPTDSVAVVVPVSPPPPVTATPRATEPQPRLRTRPPARAERCPQGARWRARPSGRRVVRVRGWWYVAGCQPVVGNPRPSVPVTG